MALNDCNCGRPWNSILPPPPCPLHSQPVYLCACRGPLDWHPAHGNSPLVWRTLTTARNDGYVGKHRKPE